jgi:hypothetical protein
MVILKTRSQVRSFIKRQTKYHNKHTAFYTRFSNDPDDPNGYGIKTSLFIDKNKIVLKKLHYMSGERGHHVYEVLAKIKNVIG